MVPVSSSSYYHYPGFGLGSLPPPELIASVPLAPSAQQAMTWVAASATSHPVVSWSTCVVSTAALCESATSTPSVPWSHPHQLTSPSMPPPSMPPSEGLILSPAGAVLPQKLVKIRSRRFIDMRALLSDNIAYCSNSRQLRVRLPSRL